MAPWSRRSSRTSSCRRSASPILKHAAPGDPTTEVAIRWGAFLNAVITFIVIAFVVWQISRMLIKEDPAAEIKTCPYCKEANAIDATKCRACASAI